MKEVSIQDSDVLSACIEAFRIFPVVMVQFPEVFGLMAMPNMEGVEGLNRVKSRLPEKLYGSVIGDLGKFLNMITDAGLPGYLNSEADFHKLNKSIVRIRIEDSARSTSVCLNGTHQALLLHEGPVRDLFRKLELAFESISDHSLFLGHAYSAPLCTSANISGHPDGSITSLDTAREFGEKHGIPLLLRCSQQNTATEKGSYPVLSLEKSSIIIERNGPGLADLISRFESGLFRYPADK